MKQGLQTIKSWLDAITQVLAGLLVVSVLIGILYPNAFGTGPGSFNPLQSIGDWIGRIGDGGLAGLLAIMLVYVWYKKR